MFWKAGKASAARSGQLLAARTAASWSADTFGSLSSLRQLRLDGCLKLESLADALCSLGRLQQLSLRHCIVCLPHSFGSLGRLHHLNLHYCSYLQELPHPSSSLGNLQEVDRATASVRPRQSASATPRDA